MDSHFNRSNQRQNQISSQLYTESLLVLDNKFRLRFLDQHRRLKAAIHKCQYAAYSNEGAKYELCEEKARECFLPLILVRRHASTIMNNAKDDFQVCLSNVQKTLDDEGSGTGLR